MDKTKTQQQNQPQTSKTLQQELKEVFERHGIKINGIEYSSVGEGQAIWTLAGESFDGPSAYIYSNGNTMFFDKEGNQIPTLQEKGEDGLRPFFKRFPEADLYICENFSEKEKVDNPENYLPPE